MFSQHAQEIHIPHIGIDHVAERLKNWNPDIDPAKVKLLRVQRVTWNNGALGCPMPDKY